MSNSSAPIVVIEDNAPIRKLFATILSKAGYEVIEFSDGNSALEALPTQAVSTIIMDILLPDINGTDLIGKVRDLDNCKDIPIIAVTGFAQSQDREKFLGFGFDAYISKPINTSAFVEEINQIRSGKSGS